MSTGVIAGQSLVACEPLVLPNANLRFAHLASFRSNIKQASKLTSSDRLHEDKLMFEAQCSGKFVLCFVVDSTCQVLFNRKQLNPSTFLVGMVGHRQQHTLNASQVFTDSTNRFRILTSALSNMLSCRLRKRPLK